MTHIFMLALLAFYFLVAHVLAQVTINTPTYGTKYDVSSGESMITVEWSVSDSPAPERKDIFEYIFTLVSGPNSNIEAFGRVGKVDAEQVEDGKFSFSLKNNVGSDGWYYIQVTALTEDGHAIQYSPRFQLTGMIGERIPPATSDITPPPPEIRIAALEAFANLNSMSFSVPYGHQNGLAKYAPMQTQPATRVTKSIWSMKNPTSSFSYFETLKRGREQLTTVTPGWSYAFQREWNDVVAAPHPVDNGGWYHPNRRQSLKPWKTRS